MDASTSGTACSNKAIAAWAMSCGLNAHHGFELGGEADVDPGSAEPGDPTAGRLCGSGRHFGAEAGHLHGLVHHQQSAGAGTVGEDSVLVPRPQ